MPCYESSGVLAVKDIINLKFTTMKTASQILEAKGYEKDEIDNIVNNLDIQVREEFVKENEQAQMVHLWECYYKGDSTIEDEKFLSRMTGSLNDLAEKYPIKSI